MKIHLQKKKIIIAFIFVLIYIISMTLIFTYIPTKASATSPQEIKITEFKNELSDNVITTSMKNTLNIAIQIEKAYMLGGLPSSSSFSINDFPTSSGITTSAWTGDNSIMPIGTIFQIKSLTNAYVSLEIYNTKTGASGINIENPYMIYLTPTNSRFNVTQEIIDQIGETDEIGVRITTPFPYVPNCHGSINFYAKYPDNSTELITTVTADNEPTSIHLLQEHSEIISSRNGYYATGYQSTYMILDNTTRDVYINYTKTVRLLTVNYYNTYHTVIKTEQRTIGVGSSIYEPVDVQYQGIIWRPCYVETYEPGEQNVEINVYCYDYSSIKLTVLNEVRYSWQKTYYDKGYNAGIQKGIKQANDKEYQRGVQAGLDQNQLTATQKTEIKKDYNAITGFFDGIWNAINNLMETIFNGIGIGGITVGTVIYTMVFIAIAVLIIKLIK